MGRPGASQLNSGIKISYLNVVNKSKINFIDNSSHKETYLLRLKPGEGTHL